MKPLAPGRFDLHCTIDQETHDALRYAQELLSHELPSGDVPQVLKLALKALIPQLEKRRFSGTMRPRPRPGRRPEDPRSVPADVQRAVWQRDGVQCTFGAEFMRHKRIAAAEARVSAKGRAARARERQVPAMGAQDAVAGS